ncbi:GNAT family N-acetyltransferase [Roseibium sp. SCP14]|uniref:GNAT family N-acetyltransferase n=1 Tax=Roseibium sp. SCP14 TaxID=3141375 RepID=UPI003335FD69
MTAYSFRPAGPDDAQTIFDLIQKLSEYLGQIEKLTACPDDFKEVGKGPHPLFQALLAEDQGEAVGLCLYFNSFSSLRGKKGVYVQDLFVTEAARGSGLGRSLLAHVAKEAASEGATYLRLSVDVENITAQKAYERIGLSAATDEQIRKIDGLAFEQLAALADEI